MSDEFEPNELDAGLRRLVRELPRESAIDPRELDHLVTALKAEGFLAPRRRRAGWAAQLAAAIVLVLLGGIAGARIATRHTLEAMLERTDLPVTERVLLMQRAGSAYVRAANGYAGAVAQTDSSAVEVASRVLLGAAQAVARSNLDGGVTPRLVEALGTPVAQPVPVQRQRVTWF
jgi:hypothetical protein